MVAVLGFSKEQIRAAVQDMYSVVARNPTVPLHFPVGRNACEIAGYTEEQLSSLPGESLESFAGVGYPFAASVIKPGQTVLDVGSGSGTDVLIASKMVGSSGKIYALDLTVAMREKLESILVKENINNVETLHGDAESIPLSDASVDVVTSNGVLNLVADKRKAISEIFRVLKPGGSVQIADIVIASPVTPDCEDDPKLWAECVVGATVEENYLEMFKDAGFEQLEVIRDYDYFAFSPSEETKEVAKQFGAHGIELRMQRGDSAPHPVVQWLRRSDPRRLARNIQRRGLWGTVAFVVAVLACYGSLAAVAIMSVLGVSMALNDGIWAGTIIFFSLLTTAIIGLGVRKHKSLVPLMVAVPGALLLCYTMFIDYHALTELLGFILLAVATYIDFDKRRWSKVSGGKDGSAANKRARDFPFDQSVQS